MIKINCKYCGRLKKILAVLFTLIVVVAQNSGLSNDKDKL
nr:MAG TPA: heterotetrameric sarcosine oxidase alpha-subunit [Caudoviricetes sp.]